MKNSKNIAIQMGNWDSLPNEMKFEVLSYLSLEDLRTMAKTNTQSLDEVTNYLKTVNNSRDPQIKSMLLQHLISYVKTTGNELADVQNKMQRNQNIIRVIGGGIIIVAGIVALSNPALWPVYIAMTLGVATFFGAKHIARILNYSHEQKIEKLQSFFQPLKKAVRSLEHAIVDSKKYQPVNQQSNVNRDESSSYRFSLLNSLTRKNNYSKVVETEAKNQNNNTNNFVK